MNETRDIWYGTSGPRNAKIVIVGEAWGREEAYAHAPFVGQSGQELTRILSEAGINRNDCFLTNVVPLRPQDNEMWRLFHPAKGSGEAVRSLHPGDAVQSGIRALYSQLATIKPKLIIAVGNYSLWSLTNCTGFTTPADAQGRRVPSGIESWRGSMWYAEHGPHPCYLLPIIHPASIMREWTKRAVTVHDLRIRVPMALADDWRPHPEPNIVAPPTFLEAHNYLAKRIARCQRGERLRLVNDIETARGIITCIGFCSEIDEAITIPFVRLEGRDFIPYWSPEEERTLLRLIRLLLMDKNCLVEGQNYLYDIQYLQRNWGINPNLQFDSMLAHHLLFPGTPKGLDYLSSLYCRYHWYWKDDNKEWDMKGDLTTHLRYNALDCLRNFEVNTILRQLIPMMDQEKQWEEQLDFNRLALKMMNRGVRIDTQRRARLALDLIDAALQSGEWFESIIPQEFVAPKAKTPWYRSAHQQKKFFTEIGLQMPKHRKTGRVTFGKEALNILSEKHPEYRRIFNALRDFRSIGVFHKTFIAAPLVHDKRMRCSFNTAGTETFRWSSSKNPFGSGTNLQNIPEGTEE